MEGHDCRRLGGYECSLTRWERGKGKGETLLVGTGVCRHRGGAVDVASDGIEAKPNSGDGKVIVAER
jgi:hypothetical protein